MTKTCVVNLPSVWWVATVDLERPIFFKLETILSEESPTSSASPKTETALLAETPT